MNSAMDTKSFGRQRELDSLSKILQQAASGRTGVGLVSGEPGIGKTHVAELLAGVAEERRFGVVRSYCNEMASSPPFWAWLQLVRGLPKRASGKSTDDSNTAAICDLLIDGIDRQHSARFVYEASSRIVELLIGYQTDQTLLLLIEDVHWADQGSLSLLELLLGTMRDSNHAFLLTARSSDPRASAGLDLVQSLARDPTAVHVPLKGIDDKSLRKIARAHSSAVLRERETSEIVRRSGGNPLFTAQLAAGFRNLGSPELPITISAMLERRLGSISTRCRETLKLASMLGQRFSYSVLEAVTQRAGVELNAEALEEARLEGLISRNLNNLDSFEFGHALIREVLFNSIETRTLQRYHRSVADVLEVGPDLADSAEIAYHLQAAGPYSDNDRLVKHSLRAGQTAIRTGGFEQAVVHFEAALQATDRTWDGEWAEASLELGFAQLLAGHGDPESENTAMDHIEAAFEFFVANGPHSRAVAIMTDYFPSRMWIVDRMLVLINKSIRLVAPGSLEEGNLQVRRGFALAIGSSHDYQAAEEALDRARAIARCHGDTRLELRSYVSQAHVEARQSKWPAMFAWSKRIVEAPDDLTATIKVFGYEGSINAALTMGNLEAARSLSVQLLRRSGSSDNPENGRAAELNRFGVAMLSGDSEVIRAILESHRSPFARPAVWEHRFAHYHLLWGEPLEAERLLDESRRAGASASVDALKTAHHRWNLARASHITLNPEYARSAARIPMPSVTDVFNWRRGWLLTDALIAHFNQDQQAARTVYDEALPYSGEANAGNWGHPWVYDSALALLATTFSDQGKAALHFQKSVEFCDSSGFLPDLYFACRDWALFLMDQGSESDATEIEELVRRSNSLATGLGFNQALTGLEILNQRWSRHCGVNPVVSRFGLSDREVEVIQLLAQGKTNRDIATELVVSPFTAAEHVSNILAKTGSKNRTEAAGLWRDNGLT